MEMTVTQDTLSRSQVRAAAVAELLSYLNDLIVALHAVPADQREAVLARDADRITAQIGCGLTAARARLAATPTPSPISS